MKNHYYLGHRHDSSVSSAAIDLSSLGARMERDSLLAALWIKYRLGVLVQVEGQLLRSQLGDFKCFRDALDDLTISGPSFDDVISANDVFSMQKMVDFSIAHGDSVAFLPREVRELRIQELSERFKVNSEFTKLALSWAHRIPEKK